MDPPMYFLWGAYLILRGIWKFFFLRNKYSGQVMSKNKINILSRNERKRNTAYRRLDNKWKIYTIVYTISLVNIRAKDVLFRISA